MAPVDQGAIGGAEVFDVPQATNGLETSVLARSEVVVNSEAAVPGDGGNGCSPSFPVLLSDVFPRREGCWKGGTVGFVGSLREAINEAGHRSIMPSSAAGQQGMIIGVGDGGAMKPLRGCSKMSADATQVEPHFSRGGEAVTAGWG